MSEDGGSDVSVHARTPRDVAVRAATSADFDAIRDIEREAGRLFAAIGMQAVADDEPFSADELAAFESGGLAWVAVDDFGAVVGYLVGRRVDGRAHLEQVSVRPSHQRRGIGQALIDRLEAWARAEGLRAITLATFRDVPWNAPLYERLGFGELALDASTPELGLIRATEAAHGLERWPRLAMIRPVDRRRLAEPAQAPRG